MLEIQKHSSAKKQDQSASQSLGIDGTEELIGNKMNLDMAFAKIGGFGNFQIIITISMCILRNSGSLLFYMFAYLVLP